MSLLRVCLLVSSAFSAALNVCAQDRPLERAIEDGHQGAREEAQGNLDRAFDHYRSACDSLFQAHAQGERLGLIFGQKHYYILSRACTDQARMMVELCPKPLDPLDRLLYCEYDESPASAHRTTGPLARAENALAELERFASRGEIGPPDSWRVYNLAGDIQYLEGNYQRAHASYQQALVAKPVSVASSLPMQDKIFGTKLMIDISQGFIPSQTLVSPSGVRVPPLQVTLPQSKANSISWDRVYKYACAIIPLIYSEFGKYVPLINLVWEDLGPKSSHQE